MLDYFIEIVINLLYFPSECLYYDQNAFPDPFGTYPAQPILFRGSQVDQLSASPNESLNELFVLSWKRFWFRPVRLCKARKDIRIDAIRPGEFSNALGEIAHLARINHSDG